MNKDSPTGRPGGQGGVPSSAPPKEHHPAPRKCLPRTWDADKNCDAPAGTNVPAGSGQHISGRECIANVQVGDGRCVAEASPTIDSEATTDKQFDLVIRAKDCIGVLRLSTKGEKITARSLEKLGWGDVEIHFGNEWTFRINQAALDELSWVDEVRQWPCVENNQPECIDTISPPGSWEKIIPFCRYLKILDEPRDRLPNGDDTALL